jgi:hypothetical protein
MNLQTYHSIKQTIRCCNISKVEPEHEHGLVTLEGLFFALCAGEVQDLLSITEHEHNKTMRVNVTTPWFPPQSGSGNRSPVELGKHKIRVNAVCRGLHLGDRFPMSAGKEKATRPLRRWLDIQWREHQRTPPPCPCPDGAARGGGLLLVTRDSSMTAGRPSCHCCCARSSVCW